MITREQKAAILIPRQATFKREEKIFVLLIDNNDIAHEHEIAVQQELDNEYIVKSGLVPGDKLVLAWVTGRKIVRASIVTDAQYAKLRLRPEHGIPAGCTDLAPLPPGIDLKDERYRILAGR